MLKATTGELLVQRGVVTPAVLARAEAAAKKAGMRLCSQLLATKACEERPLAQVLAEKHGVPGVDLSHSVVPLEALDRVPRPVAEADLILPLSLEGDRLHLAMASPRDNEKVLDEVRFVTGLEVSPYIAVEGAIEAAIRAAYDARERGENFWRGAQAGAGLAHAAVVLPGEGAEEVFEIGEDAIVEPDEIEPIVESAPAPRAAARPRAPQGDEPVGPEADPEIEISVGGEDEEVVAHVSGGGPRRVLVVDDEPEIRLLVERTLTAKGFQVDTAADGEEGLKKIGSLLPDLVLLDAMLPKMHGFEVCRKSRSEARTRQVPIIIMTAVYRGWRFAQDARETYGAEDYIEKPFRLDDLLRRVEAVLESTAGRKAGGPSVEPQFKKGKELLLAGQVDAAVAAFEEATRVDPFSAEAHYHLAKALRAKGDAFRAMTAFEKAAELRHGFFQALRSLAALYTEKGFRRKAAETLERALTSAPDAATRDAIKSDLLRLL